MASPRKLFVIWSGPKHSGKSTSASKLVERVTEKGFTTSGLLAESFYQGEQLLGFNAVDIITGKRTRLAERTQGRFFFTDKGLELGKEALSQDSTRSADLIIIDEFGPLELSGSGWRNQVDMLMASDQGLLLVVVRRELVEEVTKAYAPIKARVLDAAKTASIDAVLEILDKQVSM